MIMRVYSLYYILICCFYSRIYYFYNNGNPEYYISSADFLTRNLDKRVEILFHVNDVDCMLKLKNILSVFMNDKRNSFIMDKDGKYTHDKGDFDCHQWFIENSDKNKANKKKGK